MITSVLINGVKTPISSDFMAKVNNGETPYVRMQLVTAAGREIWIEDGDFWGNSISFTEAVSNEGAFEVGGAVIGAFNFSLNNFDRQFDDVEFAGAVVVPLIYYTINGTKEYMPKGIYYINSHRTSGNVIQCTSMDALKLLDKSQTSITYPITVQDLIETLCEANNITLATETIENGTFQLTKAPTTNDTPLTDRQMLSYVCQITGNYARMNEEGELVVGWFDFDNPYFVRSTFNGKSLWTKPIEVTGLQITYDVDGQSNVVLYGEDDCVIRIENNPFIIEENRVTISRMISERIFEIPFRPGTIPILSNPCIQAGDVLEITDSITNITFAFPVTSLTYSKNVTETINCAFEERDDIDLRLPSDYSIKVSVQQAMQQALDADTLARAAQEAAEISGYQLVIISDKGAALSEDCVVNLTAVIYDAEMNEIDNDGEYYSYRWWVMQDDLVASYLDGGKQIQVLVDDALCDFTAGIYFETMVADNKIDPFSLSNRNGFVLTNRAGLPLTSRAAERVDT